jgi:hypothetical protein
LLFGKISASIGDEKRMTLGKLYERRKEREEKGGKSKVM